MKETMATDMVRQSPPLDPATAAVDAYRLILFWPLSFEDVGAAEPDGAWTRVTDRLAYLDASEESAATPGQAVDAYAELVYFHGYVQRALYGEPNDADCPGGLRLFERTDIKTARMRIADPLGARDVTLNVDRLHLYRPSGHSAILVCELSVGPEPCVRHGDSHQPLVMVLADAMTLSDHVRRAYPPFFKLDGSPGLSPLGFQWGDGPLSVPRSREAVATQVRTDRAPPVFDHWLDVLPASMTSRDGTGRRLATGWRQLVDERMPNMTFVSLGEADGVARGLDPADRARLAAVDEYGTSAPYSAAQMERDLRAQTYDRFEHLGTYYFVSGYGFTVLGSGGFFKGLIQTHFRRQYGQMGLMLQIEAAGYLALSNHVSRAVSRPDATSASKATELRRAQEVLLDLTHRYRFTGVSNHVQGRALFTLWRQMLGNDALFHDLKDELDAGTAFLAAEKQERDTRIASRFTVLGAAFGLLGVAGLIKPPTGAALALVAQVGTWRHGFMSAALALGVGVILSLLLEQKGSRTLQGVFCPARWMKLEVWLPTVAAAGAGALFFFGLARIFGP